MNAALRYFPKSTRSQHEVLFQHHFGRQMNRLYNKTEAVNSLLALRQERIDEKSNDVVDLGAMFDSISTAARYRVVQAAEGGWRLAQPGSGALSGGVEETVVSFQGIISRMDLPPFEEKIAPGSKQVRYLRQSLTLTSLGHALYSDLVENLAMVHGIFGRAVGAKKLQDCSISSVDDDFLVIEMANRYFVPKKDSLASGGPSVDFTDDIDPHGYLSTAAGTDYVHTQDNNVLYYKRIQVKNKEGHHDYVYAAPVSFQIGDIVEVQVSFALFPLREGKFKTALILRSILLLDNTHTDKAAVLQTSTGFKKKEYRPVLLKRRVGYKSIDEPFSATRAKFQRMEIDGQRVECLD